MLKFTASWAMALFLTDNLNYAKIPFQSYVTSRTTVEFFTDDANAERVENICKGWVKV
jgi:hypothetical protein